MKSRKVLSLLLSAAMMVSTAVSVSAAAVGANENPTMRVEIGTVTAAGKAAVDFYFSIDADDLKKYAAVEDEETLDMVHTGKGVQMIDFGAALNPEYFDVDTVTAGAALTGADVASILADKSVSFTYAKNADADFVVDNNVRVFRVTANVKNSLTKEELSAKTDLVEYSKFNVRVNAYPVAGAATAKAYEFTTYYRLDGNGDYLPVVKTGADKPVIEEKDPVVTGVTVTADKDVAADGETVTFTAVVEGTEGVAADGSAIPVPQDVVWSDNAPDGVYTAVAGYEDKEVTVTATAKGTEISGSKTITVSKKAHEVVAPVITGITIAPETVAVKGGEKVTFTATVEGTDGQDETGAVVPYDKTVTWSDNAPEGVFTAPAATEEAQTIEVTATAADGKVAKATVKVYGETPIVGITGVEVTDARATLNDVFKAQNTMYWGVKITNGMKGAVEAWMTADGETSKTTTLDFSNVTINGDAEFGVFTKVAAERLDKAISLNVKDVASGTVGMSTAASYNSLAK